MALTQRRLATGLRVNDALDDPPAFFAAKGLNNRADDLMALKDAMGQAVSTATGATKTVGHIEELVQHARGLTTAAFAALGTDPSSVMTRAALARQFDTLLDQIDKLAADSGYGGKNLLAGNGRSFDATPASRMAVNSIAGIDGAKVTNVVSPDTYQIRVTGESTVSAKADAIAKAEAERGISDLDVTGFLMRRRGNLDDVAISVTGAPGRDRSFQISCGDETMTQTFSRDAWETAKARNEKLLFNQVFSSGVQVKFAVDLDAMDALRPAGGAGTSVVERNTDLRITATNLTGAAEVRDAANPRGAGKLTDGENDFAFGSGTVRLPVDPAQLMEAASFPDRAGLIRGGQAPAVGSVGPVTGQTKDTEYSLRIINNETPGEPGISLVLASSTGAQSSPILVSSTTKPGPMVFDFGAGHTATMDIDPAKLTYSNGENIQAPLFVAGKAAATVSGVAGPGTHYYRVSTGKLGSAQDPNPPNAWTHKTVGVETSADGITWTSLANGIVPNAGGTISSGTLTFAIDGHADVMDRLKVDISADPRGAPFTTTGRVSYMAAADGVLPSTDIDGYDGVSLTGNVASISDQNHAAFAGIRQNTRMRVLTGLPDSLTGMKTVTVECYAPDGTLTETASATIPGGGQTDVPLTLIGNGAGATRNAGATIRMNFSAGSGVNEFSLAVDAPTVIRDYDPSDVPAAIGISNGYQSDFAGWSLKHNAVTVTVGNDDSAAPGFKTVSFDDGMGGVGTARVPNAGQAAVAFKLGGSGPNAGATGRFDIGANPYSPVGGRALFRIDSPLTEGAGLEQETSMGVSSADKLDARKVSGFKGTSTALAVMVDAPDSAGPGLRYASLMDDKGGLAMLKVPNTGQSDVVFTLGGTGPNVGATARLDITGKTGRDTYRLFTPALEPKDPVQFTFRAANTPAVPAASMTTVQVSAPSTSNDLAVVFNTAQSDRLVIESQNLTTNGQGLRLDRAQNGWMDRADIDRAVGGLDHAQAALRSAAQTLATTLGVITTREDFTKSFSDILVEGAGKLTLADQKEDGATMLMLQTRQQLGTTGLSLASKSQQSILTLFG
ncbi:flagellin-like hook-associated protein FlgL [Azospirillum picis]|uniref:Flagellin-like hook-associated protein FlgL n=2 Tax=Azospirillum picis TaxID=488438 RepID=A0ABU0MI49_9PROT|nr:flagellin-like hook-associated protein FlgL [Azospirillum picis]MDQ0533139.1 flagellin-like hook-associated protein FlgL [Azospirillum picis]